MDDAFIADIKYWSNKLVDQDVDAYKLRHQLHNFYTEPLTSEDLYRLREVMTQYCALSSNLQHTVNLYLAAKKRPLWKKLFRK